MVFFQKSKINGRQRNEDSAKITRLKKYLKVAGIRIQNYAKLFEGCKSKKAKESKLQEMLESKGLKGNVSTLMCFAICRQKI